MFHTKYVQVNKTYVLCPATILLHDAPLSFMCIELTTVKFVPDTKFHRNSQTYREYTREKKAS